MNALVPALFSVILTLTDLHRPELPFTDNPDANQCGLPVQLNVRGVLRGVYQGRMYEPQVRLYDSHARLKVVALVESGTPGRALLQVSGPRLNYLLVRVQVKGKTLEGWVPAPYFRSR